MENVRIPRRVLGTLLNSLGAGVVPRTGLEYIAIGRQKEIAAVVSDMENIADGMSTFRFFVGKYGSGKSFLIGLVRSNALQRGFVTADADLSPERRFSGTQGQGIATYRELIKNLSVREYPDDGALEGILAGWLGDITASLSARGVVPSDPGFMDEVKKSVYSVLSGLKGFVDGFEFVRTLECYMEGYVTGDEALKSDALKWLRGEFSTRLEARNSLLGISSVIDDSNWYDHIKLLARFFKLVGYKGFLVFFDECVNLFKIVNRVSRENNYEKILAMFNDALQGKADHLGIFMGGTPQFLEDPRRGLYSYEALKSRLEGGRFTDGRNDLMGPVIRLERLTDNELFALVQRLRSLHAAYYGYEPVLTDGQLLVFLEACLKRMGADLMITPREVTRDFLGVLNVMYQDPGADFETLVGMTAAPSSDGGDSEDIEIPEIQI